MKTWIIILTVAWVVFRLVAKTVADLGATSMKDMGKVMGFINKTYAGQVNGSMVSKIVKSKLS